MLLAAVCSAVGCAGTAADGGAVTVRPGQRTVVHLLQGDGLALSLQNASAEGPGAAADPLRKVVADDRMQALLDVFARSGLLARAADGAAPGARDVLVLEHDGRRRTWSRLRAGVQDSELWFHEARAYFLQTYNSAEAFVGTSGDRPDFEDAKARAAGRAEAARLRLLELQRRQR